MPAVSAATPLPPTEPDDTPKAIREWLSSAAFAKELEGVLPRHVRAERFVVAVLNAMRKEPKLYKCTKGSLSGKILQLAGFGLEPDSQRAWLTYWEEDGRYYAEYIIGYKGYLELLWRTGVVNTVHADWVGANEASTRFSFEYGQNEHLRHQPLIAERGDPVAFYCYITFKDRGPKFEVMSIQEVNQTRDLSYGFRKAKREGKTHPWITHPGEMGKKTVFLRTTKWLELSPELRAALDSDFDALPEAAVEEGRAKEPGATTPSQPLGIFAGAVTSNGATGAGLRGHDAPAEGQKPEEPPPPKDAPKTEPKQDAKPEPKPEAALAKPSAPPPREKPFVMPPRDDPKAHDLLLGELTYRLQEIGADTGQFLKWAIAAELAAKSCAALEQIISDDLRMLLGSWPQVVIAFAADTQASVTLPPPAPKPKPPVTSPTHVASVPRPSRRRKKSPEPATAEGTKQ